MLLPKCACLPDSARQGTLCRSEDCLAWRLPSRSVTTLAPQHYKQRDSREFSRRNGVGASVPSGGIHERSVPRLPAVTGACSGAGTAQGSHLLRTP